MSRLENNLQCLSRQQGWYSDWKTGYRNHIACPPKLLALINTNHLASQPRASNHYPPSRLRKTKPRYHLQDLISQTDLFWDTCPKCQRNVIPTHIRKSLILLARSEERRLRPLARIFNLSGRHHPHSVILAFTGLHHLYKCPFQESNFPYPTRATYNIQTPFSLKSHSNTIIYTMSTQNLSFYAIPVMWVMSSE